MTDTAICRIECSARELRAMGEETERLRGKLATLEAKCAALERELAAYKTTDIIRRTK